MPVRNAAARSDFDADAALDAVLETIEGTLYACVEYDTEGYRPLYVDDETIAMYEDREQLAEHFQRIHTHVHMDFMQIELFRNTLFPAAERVTHIVTAMDYLTVVRVYVDEDGLLLTVDPDEPVGPMVETIRAAIDRPQSDWH